MHMSHYNGKQNVSGAPGIQKGKSGIILILVIKFAVYGILFRLFEHIAFLQTGTGNIHHGNFVTAKYFTDKSDFSSSDIDVIAVSWTAGQTKASHGPRRMHFMCNKYSTVINIHFLTSGNQRTTHFFIGKYSKSASPHRHFSRLLRSQLVGVGTGILPAI